MSLEPGATPYWEMHGTTVRAVEAELARLWSQATTGSAPAVGPDDGT